MIIIVKQVITRSIWCVIALFGWLWLVASADLLLEKNTVSWLLADTDLVRE